MVTVIAAAPLLVSLVAVMVAEPAATPVTRPLALTVATPGGLLAHVTTRPLSGLPALSVGVAVSCSFVPTRSMADAGLTTTDATGTVVAVIAAVPVFVSLVPVMVAEPAATAVTRPLPFTVATPGALLDHVTTRPLRVFPALSFVVGVSWTVPPT